MRRFPILAVALVAALAACSDGEGGDGTAGSGGAAAGSGGGGGNPGGSGGAVTFALSFAEPSVSMELRAVRQIELQVDAGSHVGTATLSASGLPDDVAATLTPAVLELAGAPAAATLTLTTLSSTVTGAFTVQVDATTAGGAGSATLDVTVEPAITITIPAGIAAPGGMDVFGDYPTVIRALDGMSDDNPITIRFYNADSVYHRIQGHRADVGFPVTPHPGIEPMGYETPARRVTATGEFDFYLHDLGPTAGLGRILIQ